MTHVIIECMEGIGSNQDGVAVKNISIDPEAARAAYAAMRARAEAVAAFERVALTVDLQDAVIRALGVARFVAQAGVRARFELLPPELFDPTHLDELLTLALATHHGHVELQTLRAGGSTAKLPADLVAQAGEVRGRMLELCEYMFRRDLRLALEVASIRSGTGYKDEAVDLVRLANIYDEQAETVARDPINYRATDAADARRLSQAILHELGNSQGADERAQLAIVTGLWTLLLRCYDEVQTAGSFLFRNQDPERKFPSLFTRRGRRVRTAPAPETPTTPEPGVTPA